MYCSNKANTGIASELGKDKWQRIERSDDEWRYLLERCKEELDMYTKLAVAVAASDPGPRNNEEVTWA